MKNEALNLPKYSVGVGDRFAHQAKAQLRACMEALDKGVEVVPVWNKSNREHTIIGSEPSSVRQAADAAVTALGWTRPYFCDADHITSQTVARFVAACDFYTIDVADFIGQPAAPADIDVFINRHSELLQPIALESFSEHFTITPDLLRKTTHKYLAAVKKAGEVYRIIVNSRGEGNFIPEISMDETDSPQTPLELLIILAAIADEGVPVQTIAPKFSGRFNKGVEYQGEVAQFEHEFALDVAAIAYAVKHFGLPANLKLSVHSGSDKFSLYRPMHKVIQQFNAGVHLKTAGTTWLEELIGLAEAGATDSPWQRRSTAKPSPTAKSCAYPTRPSSTSNLLACLLRQRCSNGTQNNTPPHCDTSRVRLLTTRVSGNFFMSASKSRRRWADGISICLNVTKP